MNKDAKNDDIKKERRRTLEKKFLEKNKKSNEKGVIKEENIWEMIEKMRLQSKLWI
jgi:hypothetical protein